MACATTSLMSSILPSAPCAMVNAMDANMA